VVVNQDGDQRVGWARHRQRSGFGDECTSSIRTAAGKTIPCSRLDNGNGRDGLLHAVSVRLAYCLVD
jgi:hypothetical protein